MKATRLLIHYLLSLVTFICVFSDAYAQGNFQQFTKSDGLPSQEIYDIHQDHNGLIWIATDRGIASFNGSFFNVYSVKDGLPNDVVFEFFPQEDNTIWCTTLTNELFYFNPDELVFHEYKFNEKLKKLPQLEQRALRVNKDGSIDFRFNLAPGFIHVSNTGRLINNQGEITANPLDPFYLVSAENGYQYFNSTPKKSNTILSIVDLKVRLQANSIGDTTLISAEDGWFILAKDQIIKKELYPENRVTLKTGVSNKHFWFAYHNFGIVHINSSGEVEGKYTEVPSATCFLEDNDGGIWIGSLGSGLYYKGPLKIQLVSETRNMVILDLSINDKKQLLFGTNAGILGIKTKDKIVLRRLSEYVKPRGQFYTSTNEYFFNPSISEKKMRANKMSNCIVSRYSDERDRLPLLIFFRYVLNDKFKVLYGFNRGNTDYISDAEYIDEHIVLSTKNKIIKINKNGKVLSEYELSVAISELDVRGESIYCATRGKGLILLNKDLKVIRQVGKKDGLASNYIYEVLVNDSDVWVGTNMGLSRIYTDDLILKVSSISAINGLLDQEVRDIEILDGVVYIGTNFGLYYFKLSDWDEITKNKSKIYFKSRRLLVNGKEYNSLLGLSFNQNEIEIQFDMISFEQQNGISFRYKLNGLDENWNETTDRKVLFKSLPPGEYELIIQPMFNGVPREETIRQKISILPAFYNTWWFNSSLIALIILATWAFFRFRILQYNRELIREVLRYAMKRLRPKSKSFVVRSNGKDILINSEEIQYAKSDGNYLSIYTDSDRIVIREKISQFTQIVPDPFEYLRVRRSVVVRKDKISGKNSDTVLIGKTEIKIGNTYRKKVNEINL